MSTNGQSRLWTLLVACGMASVLVSAGSIGAEPVANASADACNDPNAVQVSLSQVAPLAYDPLGGAQGASLAYRINNSHSAACSVRVVLERKAANWNLEGPQPLVVEEVGLETEGQILDRHAGKASFDGQLTVPANSAQEITLRLTIPGGQFVPATDLAEYRLALAARFELVSTKAMIADFNDAAIGLASVQRRAQLNLAATSAVLGGANSVRFDVDFGQLESGETQRVGMQMRGNTGVTVSFSSLNQGHLVHTVPGVTARVPYTFSVGGRVLDLASGPQNYSALLRGTTETTQISMGLGQLPPLPAGRYSDVILVDLLPL